MKPPKVITFTNSPSHEDGFQSVVTWGLGIVLLLVVLLVVASARDLETNYRKEAEHGGETP